ncbi:hypothetical protein SB770_35210, partial [Pseudomonas sp. SIMBA_044]
APVGSFAAAPEMEASADAAPPAMSKPRAESSNLAKRMSAPAAPRAIKRFNEQLQTVLRLWDEG